MPIFPLERHARPLPVHPHRIGAAGLLAGLLALAVCVSAAGWSRAEAAQVGAGTGAGAGRDADAEKGSEEFDEYHVKAAFLYNLIGYTT